MTGTAGFRLARGIVALFGAMAFCATGALLGARSASTQVLQATGLLPAHLASTFKEPITCLEAQAGEELILDRRGHAIFAVNVPRTVARKVVAFGEEDGHLAQPGALALGPNGSFAVADAPWASIAFSFSISTASTRAASICPTKSRRASSPARWSWRGWARCSSTAGRFCSAFRGADRS